MTFLGRTYTKHSCFFFLYNFLRLIQLFSLISKTEKNMNPQMVTHLSIDLGQMYLTSEIWPFFLTAFSESPNDHPSKYWLWLWLLNFSDLTIHPYCLHFWPCLCCANLRHLRDRWAVNFVFFVVSYNRIPNSHRIFNLNDSKFAQH